MALSTDGKKNDTILIVFEGCHGAGKSTQCDLLTNRLLQTGRSVGYFEFHDRDYAKRTISTFLSYGLVTPEMISASLNISFMATVAEADRLEVDVLIFHRYKYTGLLKDYFHGIPAGLTLQNYGPCPTPDVLFFLGLRPEESLQRIESVRQISFYETEYLYSYRDELTLRFTDYHRGKYDNTLLRESYLRQMKKENEFWKEHVCSLPYCHMIDAMLPRDEIAEEIFAVVNCCLLNNTH